MTACVSCHVWLLFFQRYIAKCCIAIQDCSPLSHILYLQWHSYELNDLWRAIISLDTHFSSLNNSTGVFLKQWASQIITTFHPSSISNILEAQGLTHSTTFGYLLNCSSMPKIHTSQNNLEKKCLCFLLLLLVLVLCVFIGVMWRDQMCLGVNFDLLKHWPG